MSKTIGSLLVRIAGDNSALMKSLKSTENSLYRSGRNIQRLGDQMTKGITLPFALAAGAGAKFFLETERNFAKIENLVGITGKSLNTLKDGVNAISGPLGVSSQALSDALFTVTSAGARGGAALSILQSAAKASAVGLGETKQIAQATTAILQAYGKENISAAKATDVLFATVRAGNLDAESLAPNLGKVIGLAAQMGISFEEVGASIATYTRLGVNAEEATTGLSAIMSSILSPTAEAEKGLLAVGLSADGLRQSVKEKGLSATLLDLMERFKGNDAALATVIPNIRALRAVLGTAGVQAEDYANILKEVEASTGLVDEGFKNVSQTAGQKLKVALTTLQNAAEQIGAVVVPIFAQVATFIGNIAAAFQKLSPETQKNIIKWTMLAAAIGPVLSLYGGAKMMIAGFLKNGLIPLTKWLGNAGKAMVLMRNSTMILYAGFAALALGAVLIVKNWDKVKGVLVKAINYFIQLYNKGGLFTKVIQGLILYFKTLKAAVLGVFEIAKAFFSTIGKAGKALISGDFAKIPGLIKDGWDKAAAAVTNGADTIKDEWATAFDFKEIDPISGDDVDNFLSPVTDGIGKLKEGFNNLFKDQTLEVDFASGDITAPKVLPGTDANTGTSTGTNTTGATAPTRQREEITIPTIGTTLGTVGPIMAGIDAQINKLKTSNELLGTSFNIGKEKINLLKEALTRLINEGYSPQGGEIKAVVDQLKLLGVENKTVAAILGRPMVIPAPNVEPAKTALQELAESFKTLFADKFANTMANLSIEMPHLSVTRENIRQLNEELKQNQAILSNKSASEADKQAATDRIKSIQHLIKAEKEKGNVMLQTAKATLKAARDSIKASLAEALAGVLAKALVSVPFPFNIGIAGAAVAAASALFDKVVPALAEGGIATGPTLAVVGDNPGAKSDPEVIAPLSKLKDMISGMMKPTAPITNIKAILPAPPTIDLSPLHSIKDMFSRLIDRPTNITVPEPVVNNTPIDLSPLRGLKESLLTAMQYKPPVLNIVTPATEAKETDFKPLGYIKDMLHQASTLPQRIEFIARGEDLYAVLEPAMINNNRRRGF